MQSISARKRHRKEARERDDEIRRNELLAERRARKDANTEAKNTAPEIHAKGKNDYVHSRGQSDVIESKISGSRDIVDIKGECQSSNIAFCTEINVSKYDEEVKTMFYYRHNYYYMFYCLDRET